MHKKYTSKNGKYEIYCNLTDHYYQLLQRTGFTIKKNNLGSYRSEKYIVS